MKIESEMGLVGGVSDGGAVRMVSGDHGGDVFQMR